MRGGMIQSKPAPALGLYASEHLAAARACDVPLVGLKRRVAALRRARRMAGHLRNQRFPKLCFGLAYTPHVPELKLAAVILHRPFWRDCRCQAFALSVDFLAKSPPTPFSAPESPSAVTFFVRMMNSDSFFQTPLRLQLGWMSMSAVSGSSAILVVRSQEAEHTDVRSTFVLAATSDLILRCS